MTKSRFFVWPAVFLMLAPNYLPAGIMSIAYAIIVLPSLIFSRKIIGKNIYVIIPIIIIVIVSTHGVFYNYNYPDVVKDIWYLGNPALALAAGYFIFVYMSDVSKLYFSLIIAALIAVSVHLTAFVISPELFSADIVSIRDEAGKGFYLLPIAIVICLYSFRGKVDIYLGKKSTNSLMLFILILSLTLSYSRALWLMLALMIIPVFKLYKLFNYKVILFLFISIGISSSLLFYQSKQMEFKEKFYNTLNELSALDSWNIVDINQRWRAYEVYRAEEEFNNAYAYQKMIGYGAGYLLDMKLNIILGEEEHRFIPVFHNGYWYLLIKTGFIGLMLYLLFLYKLIKISVSSSNCPPLNSGILIGISISLIALSFVVSGIYNKSAFLGVLFFTGALLRCMEPSDKKDYTSE